MPRPTCAWTRRWAWSCRSWPAASAPDRRGRRSSVKMAPMQTFLPVADFEESARLLDSPRLGKQRVETLQVLRALELPDYGWANHPVATMWRRADGGPGRVRTGHGAGLAGARLRRQHRGADRRVRAGGRRPAAGGARRGRAAAVVGGRRGAAPVAPVEPAGQGPGVLPRPADRAVRSRTRRPALRLARFGRGPARPAAGGRAGV